MNYGDKYKREPQSGAPFLCLYYSQQPANEGPEGGHHQGKDELLTLIVATHRHHHVPS